VSRRYAKSVFQTENTTKVNSMKFKLHLGQLLASAALLTSLQSLPAAGGMLEEYQLDSATTAFSLVDLKDNTTQLADYRGKVLLVNFWASWCPPCIKEMPSLQRLQQQLDDKPFTILAINVGEPKYKVWKFAQLINLTLPVLLDPESDTFYAWNSTILPTSFLLDRQGRVLYRAQGDVKWDSEDIVSLINRLLAEPETSQE
jgi:thiol-disulfide isomerase/thioredoxin